MRSDPLRETARTLRRWGWFYIASAAALSATSVLCLLHAVPFGVVAILTAMASFLAFVGTVDLRDAKITDQAAEYWESLEDSDPIEP